jgi:hypothetical protein
MSIDRLIAFALCWLLVMLGAAPILRDPVTGELWRRAPGGGGATNLLTDANGDDCCCVDCCECGNGAEPCCYQVGDTATLTISRTHSVLRYCDDACASNTLLACFDCTDYIDSCDYTIVSCDETKVRLERVGGDTCFPYAIERECGSAGWVPLDEGDNELDWHNMPRCPQCVLDCDFDPMLCGAIAVCSETLHCNSGGEADESDPPEPFTTCTHDDGAETGGASCFCSGSTCYTFDFKAWIPVCVFDENIDTCQGDGVGQDDITITVEVALVIDQTCEWDEELERCVPAEN